LLMMPDSSVSQTQCMMGSSTASFVIAMPFDSGPHMGSDCGAC
jgi:hypothetical protein